ALGVPVSCKDRRSGSMYDTVTPSAFEWRPQRGGVIEGRVASARHKDDRFDEVVALRDDPRADFAGRWRVKFSSSDDHAVGVFEVREDGIASGTFLTTTGDYRYLAGRVDGPILRLSCFDGAHAFLFKALMLEDGTIAGEFWSGDWWFETWTAERDPDAKLPDAFEQTTLEDPDGLRALRFPTLAGDGDASPLEAAGEAKVTLVKIFGSWCPNCHDATEYLKELRETHGDRGLRVIALAFEREAPIETQRERLNAYLARHHLDGEKGWPVLIAGLSDKKQASEVMPLLDRVRSYPTTLFVDSAGRVRHVHTGFTGPATGEAYAELRVEWERRIEAMLKE
ncbi:MAG: TlpA disulfide reductase family protein, partial [Planctomycetota bacterium]